MLMRFAGDGLLPGSQAAVTGTIAWALFGGLLALRWLAWLPEGAQRASRVQGSPAARLAVLIVPAEAIGMARLAVLTAGGCLAWIARRPLPPRPAGVPVEDRKKGSYDGFFLINLVSFVPEIPISFLVLSSVALPLIHVAVHAAEFLVVVLVLGDRRLVRAGGHVLGDTHLHLRAGARAAATLPLEAIAGLHPLDKKTSYAAWCRAHGAHLRDTGVVSIFDGPNLVVSMQPGLSLSWTRFQVERPLPRHLFLYVDNPAGLIAAIERAKADLATATTAG